MKCAYLSGTQMLYCTVSKPIYIPSLFELEEYCTTPRHKKCPLACGPSQKGKDHSNPHKWPKGMNLEV